MSALAHIVRRQIETRSVRRDVGPEREILVTYDNGGEQDVKLAVRYRVSYGSARERAFGREPEVELLSVTYDAGDEWREFPLRPIERDWLIEQIEEHEHLDAPCNGD